MEVLFSTTLASYEAWLMVLCVIVFFGIYLFDGIAFVQRVYSILNPIRPIASAGGMITPEVISPILEPIAPEEVEAHKIEKVRAEEKQEQKIIESEVFEEKILEEIQLAEKQEEIENIKEIDKEDNIEEIDNIQETSNTEKLETGADVEKIRITEDTTDTTKGEALPGGAHTIPITASIQEAVPEIKKVGESQHVEKLYTIVSEVKTLLARGIIQDARALIIEGLSLDKNHRELNLILGSLYESERQAQKAEYIYRDLALIYTEDGEILERLANILIIEKRYDIALEIYKKIISLSSETEGSLYIMTHLAHELGNHEELHNYARRYQKGWPNNPEILSLLAEAEVALGKRKSAIQTLIKLKNLTPYNAEIVETIAKLTMEEELAGNFGNR